MEFRQSAEGLFDLIHKSTCAIMTAQYCKEQLLANGFEFLEPNARWNLEVNGAYVTVLFDSSVVAFTVGEMFPETGKLKMAAAHTDFPGFCIKPAGEWRDNGYLKLNVESYGGVLLPSWMDRPLSLSGKVVLGGEEPFQTQVRYVDFKRPLMTMPNLAVHLNRQANENLTLDKQVDLQPLCDAVSGELAKDGYFLRFLAEELGVAEEEILNFELYLYVAEDACVMGLNDSLISGPRLDNLTSVQACMRGIMEGTGQDSLQMMVLYDNEEIGSSTKQGAGSMTVLMLLEKIYAAFGMDRIDMLNSVMSGKLLSVDVAHGFHPNHPEKYDVTNRTWLNQGVVIKTASTKSYVCDIEMMTGVMQLCRANGIPFQTFANRSNVRGGSTLGAIVSHTLPMQAQDIGVPILAMHSARETMGLNDQAYLEELLIAYFS